MQAVERFHMTSLPSHWCPKTMKRQPCWWTKPFLFFPYVKAKAFFCSNIFVLFERPLTTWVYVLHHSVKTHIWFFDCFVAIDIRDDLITMAVKSSSRFFVHQMWIHDPDVNHSEESYENTDQVRHQCHLDQELRCVWRSGLLEPGNYCARYGHHYEHARIMYHHNSCKRQQIFWSSVFNTGKQNGG